MVSDSPSLSRRAVLVAGGLFTSTLALSGGDTRTNSGDAPWPMARHDPGGTSYAAGIDGPRDGVDVRWTHSVADSAGVLAPTPVVAGGVVYLVGRGLVAVDADDGTERFRYPESPRVPPAVADARAYRTPTVALGGRRSVGLHARGGPALFGWRPAMTRWTTAESGDTAFGFGGATETPPVAADGAILAYIGGDLSAIDASSGRVRWQAERTQRRPAVRDGTVYALDLGTVHGFDLASGTHHTVVTVDDGLRSVTAAPDRLLVGTGDSLLGISYDGTTEWTYAPDGRSSLEAVAPAVADGVAYASFAVDDTDRLLALDARDGTALWDVPLSVEGGGGGHAALAVSEEMVYLPTPEGVVGLDRSDGRVRWTFDADTLYPWSSVALADGRVYAFAEKTLYALEEA